MSGPDVEDYGWNEFSADCKRITKEKASSCNSECSSDKFRTLYVAVNEMMAPLGAHGEICARDDRVDAVMDALHDIDGGVYDTKKVFGR